jgi:hypothetical protein
LGYPGALALERAAFDRRSRFGKRGARVALEPEVDTAWSRGAALPGRQHSEDRRDNMEKSVLAIVETKQQAEHAIGQLQGRGFSPGAISVLMPGTMSSRDFAHEHNTKAPEGAIAGVGAGGAVGGTLGVLAGMGALAIPGIGPLVAAGPIIAALSGAAAGAAVGGVAGSLVGLGIPEIEAKRYEGKINGGNILIAVHVEDGDRQKLAEVELKEAGAHDITSTRESSVPRNRMS